MNRELKFRAWYNDKFHYNIEKHHVEHHSMSGFSGDVWDFSDWLKYAKVQQYTGLKDKNGGEIYEGDILIFRPSYKESLGGQFGNAIFPTSFNDGSFRFGDEFAEQEAANYYEIIGNIFENPELLTNDSN